MPIIARPFLLQGTDLVTLVPERASGHLRRTAAVRFLEPPLHLPSITEMLWWNPRHTADPAHGWLRSRIAEIAAELDRRPGGEAPVVIIGAHGQQQA
jgi:LysR family transcriptional regulator, nod-box dependent transcriptional activator